MTDKMRISRVKVVSAVIPRMMSYRALTTDASIDDPGNLDTAERLCDMEESIHRLKNHLGLNAFSCTIEMKPRDGGAKYPVHLPEGMSYQNMILLKSILDQEVKKVELFLRGADTTETVEVALSVWWQ